MKKTLFFLGVAVLFTIIGFTILSCNKDNPIDCAAKLTEVSAASINYTDSYDACIDYKNALEDYINCDGIADKVYYESIYNELDCDLYLK